jgi:hypothetical protein
MSVLIFDQAEQFSVSFGPHHTLTLNSPLSKTKLTWGGPKVFLFNSSSWVKIKMQTEKELPTML